MNLEAITIQQLKEMIKYFEYCASVTDNKYRKIEYLQRKKDVIHLCDFFNVRID